MADSPDQVSIDYQSMAARWKPLDALLGGTIAMRAAKEDYLPRHSKETYDKYNIRLTRSVLEPAYEDGIETLAAKPFSRPVSYEGDLPPELEAVWNDLDLQGTTPTNFAKRFFALGVHRGLCHILVDAPGSQPKNLADQRTQGVRPYATVIDAKDMIAWRFVRVPGTGYKVTHIRFYERATAPDGEFGEVEVLRIRSMTATGTVVNWKLFEKSSEGDWVQNDAGRYLHPEGLPLVTFYTKKLKPMVGSPPLEQLGHMNIRHWQSDSEQQDLLQFARVGVWFARGWSKEELQAGLTIGAHRFVGTTNPDGQLEVVEHSGKAIDAGRADLDSLERRMKSLVQEQLTMQPGNIKATGQAIAEGKQQSRVGQWVMDANAALRRIMEMAAGFYDGAEVPEMFQPHIFSDFVVSTLGTAEDVRAIMDLRANRDLSRQTTFEELQRRGFLSDRVDAEEEEKRLAEEAVTDLQAALPDAPQPPAPSGELDEPGADDEAVDEP